MVDCNEEGPTILSCNPSDVEILRLLEQHAPHQHNKGGVPALVSTFVSTYNNPTTTAARTTTISSTTTSVGVVLQDEELLQAVAIRLVLAMALVIFDLNRIGDNDEDICYRHSGGLMITAAHEPEPYNGILLMIDSDQYYAKSEESSCESENPTVQLAACVHKVLEEEPQAVCDWFVTQRRQELPLVPAVLHMGYDTRRTSPDLADLVLKMACVAGLEVWNHGEITTPCLRHVVRNYNRQRQLQHQRATTAAPISSPYDEDVSRYSNNTGYCNYLADAYAQLVRTVVVPTCIDDYSAGTPSNGINGNSLLVDCAGGIGYLQLRLVVIALQSRGIMRRIVATNRIGSAPLNLCCGAHHVLRLTRGKEEAEGIANFTTWYNTPPIGKVYCAALSGDGSHSVFFSETSNFILAPHIVATLLCTFLQEELSKAEMPLLTMGVAILVEKLDDDNECVALKYLRERLDDSVPIITAPSGPQDQHQQQRKGENLIPAWDVALLIHNGGHVGIKWGARFHQELTNRHREPSEPNPHVQRLTSVACLCQDYPDGLATLLMVDAILQVQRKSLEDYKGD